MTTKEKIEVMEHYENGGKIEIRLESGNNYGNWEIREKKKDGELSWCWSQFYPTENYRIYKEKKVTVTIEKWLCIEDGENYCTYEGDTNYFNAIENFETKKVKLLDTYEVTL